MESSESKYKHKPSEKHTLEEVLKSLQDLIRVDLSESRTAAGKPEKPPSASPARAPAEAKPIREKPSSQREDFAPASPGAGPVNLDAVMRSLSDLITHELNVGDEPKPAKTKPAATHDEYLATEENIEEYIPEELSQLDDELKTSDEPVREELEAAPPPEEVPAPGTKDDTTLPEEFTPLDEELTIEEPVELARPAAPTETTELPGEISPELLGESVSPPPGVDASPPEPEKDLAPGEQHEMSFEEVPSPAPEPESVSMDSALARSPEPELAPKPSAPLEEREQAVETKQEEAAEALPTIDVEESFDDNDYFAAAASGENTPPASEETIDLSAEISPEPQTDTPPVAETTAAPEPEEPPVAPAEATGEKITLEIADEPVPGKTHDKYSVDFDLPDLSPPLPEEPEPSPPVAGPTAESEAPVETTEAESTPEPESTAPAPDAPAVEAKTETPPTSEPPHETGETPAPEAPASLGLDDIPVLKDVVDPRADDTLVTESSTPAAEPPLPAPDRAREIVVRAVAKLNVEMRKSGSAGLDTRTILRLQQLIRQELEKGGKK